MKFLNATQNSVYLEDIDMHIPFEEGEVIEIDTDDVKKSRAFQNLIVLGAFEIVEANDERIEQNLLRLQPKDDDSKSEEEDRDTSGEAPEVIIKGHFYEAGGYAKTNRNLAICLAAKGCKVEADVTSTRKSDLNELEARMMASFKQKVGRQAIRIDSIIPSFSQISPKMPYRILYTTIEASSMPKQTVDICNSYDEVWVTADYCKEVMQKEGVTRPIFVMPNAIQTKMFHEHYEPHEFRPPLNSFVFCSLFGWAYRKGWDALLKAYFKAFDGNDDVSLLIVSRYQYSSERSGIIKQDIDKYLKQYGGDNPPHVCRCSRVIPEFELPRIYKACDAFVLPSRGEGFGLPYAEASLCGLPVIATNHSGHTMFLNEGNSELVDIDSLEPVPRGSSHVHYWDGQLMANLKSEDFIDRLAESMRYVYENQEEAKKRNKLLQQEIANSYSFQNAADRYSERISEIWKKIKETQQ